MCKTSRVDLRSKTLDKLTASLPCRKSAVLVPDNIVSVKDRTEALLRGFQVVLRHHGAPELITNELLKQLRGYLGKFNSEDVWVKHVKHTLTYPLAKYLRNEPPKTTGDDFHPVGFLKKWYKNRLLTFSRKNTHLWYSWFQVKRAALPMSDDFVDTTYKEHFEALTRDDDGQDDVIDEIFEDPAFILVLKQIADSVEKSFDWNSFSELQPSTNAAFESSRKDGGQQEWLRKIINFEESDVACDSELWKMEYSPIGYYVGGFRLNVCSEIRERQGRDQWNRIVVMRETIDANLRIGCTIQAVLEPMKVRVISKGEALPYYSMKPLQKSLWKAMKDMPCFRLIGRPFSPTDVLDLKTRAMSTDEWFSVDYSAATDGLSWKYSGRILEHVISLLPSRVQDIAMSVLGPHRLHYPNPERKGEIVFKGVMRRGQLMGSILSFPILCLANLGVYLRTMKYHQKDWSISDQLNHVLVNGDDMLYAAPADLWSDHIKYGQAVGLNMSVGKSYHHPVYANVNSTSVHCDIRVPKSTPWTIDFLNVGLFFGQHKVQSKEDKSASHHDDGLSNGCVSVIPLLLQGCLPGRQKDLLKQYLVLHSDVIKDETRFFTSSGKYTPDIGRVSSRNLFLPLSIGGCGIVCPQGFKYKVTTAQKLLAKKLRNDAVGLVTTSLPLPGYEFRSIDEIAARPWAVKSHTTVDTKYNVRGLVVTRKEWYSLRNGFVEYSPTSNALRL